MMNPHRVLTFVVLFAAALAVAQTAQPVPAAPDISGDWAGTWSYYNPAQGATAPKEICKDLTSKVAKEGELWQATFEGNCGRPYKYTIKMEGRQIGKVVLFKGTTDLGPRDGGVYDWIGRANEKEFFGFYTSAQATGTFILTRKQ